MNILHIISLYIVQEISLIIVYEFLPKLVLIKLLCIANVGESPTICIEHLQMVNYTFIAGILRSCTHEGCHSLSLTYGA